GSDGADVRSSPGGVRFRRGGSAAGRAREGRRVRAACARLCARHDQRARRDHEVDRAAARDHRETDDGGKPVSDLPRERELLLRARKGDEGAARALWQRLAPRMIGYAGLIAGAADAEDVAQVVFVRALSARRREIARIDDLAGWLL